MQKYLADVEELLDRLYIAAEGAGLRQEDRRKAVEVAAMLEEIERAVSRFSRRSRLLLVDAAAGKSYVGLLAAKLVLDASGRPASVLTIERDPQRVEASRRAAERLGYNHPGGMPRSLSSRGRGLAAGALDYHRAALVRRRGRRNHRPGHRLQGAHSAPRPLLHKRCRRGVLPGLRAMRTLWASRAMPPSAAASSSQS